MNDAEADARTEIEQTRKQPRADAVAEQELGEWRARPEQGGGCDGQRRAGPSQEIATHRTPPEGAAPDCRFRECASATSPARPQRSLALIAAVAPQICCLVG